MKPKTLLLTFFVSYCAMSIISCKTKTDDHVNQKDSLFVADADAAEIDALNDSILSLAEPEGVNIIQGSASKGDTWKNWERIFFACFQDETFRKNKVYLGVSNLKYLGTILSKNKSTTKRELVYILPPSEFENFASIGVEVDNCKLLQEKRLSLDLILQAVYGKVDAELKTALTKYDSVIFTGGQWRIDELRTDDFLDYIKESTNPKVQAYERSLLEGNNLVITKVVKVNGFSAEIHSSNKFSAGLKGKLAINTDSIPVISPDSTNSNLSLKVDFSSKKDKVVKVGSKGQFYVFAMVQKGRKL